MSSVTYNSAPQQKQRLRRLSGKRGSDWRMSSLASDRFQKWGEAECGLGRGNVGKIRSSADWVEVFEDILASSGVGFKLPG